jgi:hypothetical protein
LLSRKIRLRAAASELDRLSISRTVLVAAALVGG